MTADHHRSRRTSCNSLLAPRGARHDRPETDALLHAYFRHAPDAAWQRGFDAMHCASLLRAAMWAMVSDIHLAAPRADYRTYARKPDAP
ncbi:MAG: hypothetical protein ACK4RZ_17320 [Paracoccaceae bacterium]